MKFINRKTHAVLDYLVGVLLIASPWLFGFSDIADARWIIITLGLVALLMSPVTDYEGGLIKMIPMSMHLNMDALSGILLTASPWIFGFHEQVYLPHLLFGLLEIVVAMCTQNRSQHVQLSGNPSRRSF